MKRLFMIFSALMIALPVYAQKIETRNSGQDQIVPVKTALNHLTVIQLAEPVLSVAAGSDAFKVEWRGNKVFVEPTAAGVSTNLFIWTRSGRENYELEPVGPVASMDFAIDTPAFDPPPAPKPSAKATPPADPMKALGQWMLGGTPVKQERWKAEKHHVQVMVRDLFEQHGELFIRYSIENRTKRPYAPGAPHVYEVTSDASERALLAHACTQLNGVSAQDLGSEVPLSVVGADLRAQNVPPGKETVGVVGVKLPGSGPAVLKLDLADDRGLPVNAVVVI